MIYVSHLLCDEDMKEICGQYGAGVESIEFSISDNLDQLERKMDQYKKRLEQMGNPPLILHGPFLDLNPASFDSRIRKVTMERFDQCYQAGIRLGAKKIVYHSGMIPTVYFREGWAEQTGRFFQEFLKDREGPQVVMENVLDEDWRLLLDVYNFVDHPNFKLCLDMGHAHCYSEISVLEWAKELAPYVGHVHIHDNAGDRDSHLGLGKGTIPWEKVLKILPCTKERTWTIECSNKEDVILCIKQINGKMRGEIMNRLKKRTCQFLVLVTTAGLLTGCGRGTPKLEDALKKTAAYEQKTVTSPASDTLGGEWTVIALARSGETVDENYFEKYRANLEKRVKDQEGVLSDNRYTEYSRAVMALKSIGKDPTDIGGYDIEKPLEDFDAVVSQGLNGAIYALIALNADDPEANKDGDLEQKYLDYILEREKADGGFSLDDNAEDGDVDLTAMTLQSLEPYQDEEDVKEVIDKGVEFLAEIQDDDGGYTAFGAKSSESISQTVIALSAVGVDCNEDERFQKDGKGLYDTLMTFYQKDGSFKHILDGESDPMATDQGFCALVAYQRYQDKENSFFDMTDHR